MPAYRPNFVHARPHTLVLQGRRWRCRQAPRTLPPFWMPLRLDARPLTSRRLRVWSYVLQALRLPHYVSCGRQPALYVPVFLLCKCRINLAEYEGEGRLPAKRLLPVELPLAWIACLVTAPVVLAHLVRVLPAFGGLGQALGLPADPALWPEVLGCDNVRMRLFGEWTRAATALFVHADAAHLMANTAFTLFFTRLLAGRTGWGFAALLFIWPGICGNVMTALLRQPFTLSIGFSTALFSGIGALSGFVALYSRPQAILPLAAGLALLALLGTGGENTDYPAHVSGLVCGMAAGCAAAFFCRHAGRVPGTLCQAALFAASLALPALCLWLRLQS